MSLGNTEDHKEGPTQYEEAGDWNLCDLVSGGGETKRSQDPMKPPLGRRRVQDGVALPGRGIRRADRAKEGDSSR